MTLGGVVRVDKFKRQLQHYRAEFSRNAAVELKRQARLFVFDCIKLTPPFPQTSPNSTSLNAHRAAGDNATFRDIGIVFKPIKEISGPRRGTQQTMKGLGFIRDEKLRNQVEKYALAGDTHAVMKILERIKVDAGVLQTVDAGLHKARRDKRGRVRRKGRPWVVLDTTSLKGYIRHKLSHVGMAKSGWQRPYYANGGARLPAWISRHPVRGIYSSGRDGSGFYERVGNDIPWIQDTGAELRIIGRATDNRIRNLSIEMAKLVQHAKRKAGF